MVRVGRLRTILANPQKSLATPTANQRIFVYFIRLENVDFSFSIERKKSGLQPGMIIFCRYL